MQTVTKSIDVATSLATAVHQWSTHERSARHFPDAMTSFQALADEKTRVILSVGHRSEASTGVVELMLEDELEQFKETVEADRPPLRGFIGWFRRRLR